MVTLHIYAITLILTIWELYSTKYLQLYFKGHASWFTRVYSIQNVCSRCKVSFDIYENYLFALLLLAHSVNQYLELTATKVLISSTYLCWITQFDHIGENSAKKVSMFFFISFLVSLLFTILNSEEMKNLHALNKLLRNDFDISSPQNYFKKIIIRVAR